VHPECIVSFNEMKVVDKLCHVSYLSAIVTLSRREREDYGHESADSVLPAIGGHTIKAKCHPASKV